MWSVREGRREEGGREGGRRGRKGKGESVLVAASSVRPVEAFLLRALIC